MNHKLLVTIDSLRYDHFQYMERTRAFLDREHDKAFSTFPETFGSFPSIIGGEYATERGLPAGTSLANGIDDKSIGITTNHLLSPAYNYDEGFDYFHSPEASDEGVGGWISDKIELRTFTYKILTTGYNWIQLLRSLGREQPKSFRRVSDVISEFNQTRPNDDWFGWLHLMEPHHPYDPDDGPVSRDKAQRISRRAIAGRLKNEEEAELVRDLYRREVSQMDKQLAELWETIPDNTEVIVTGDHGELLGDDQKNRWGHTAMLHPFLFHVPFGMKNVDVDLGKVVSLIDIPTILTGEEHGQGTLDREVAYGLYGQNRMATDGSRMTAFWPEENEWLTWDIKGNVVGDEENLDEEIFHFDLNGGGVTTMDADEEQLRQLGYIE